MNEPVTLTTTDGLRIVADVYKTHQPKQWLVLLHMMPATRESWRSFAERVCQEGYSSIAVDLRGHGESAFGPQGFLEFENAEHQSSIKDVEAAWDYAVSQGAQPDQIILIGASIGANLALWFLTEHANAWGAILLSAGDYRGLDARALSRKLNPNHKILFIASRNDIRSDGTNNGEYAETCYDVITYIKHRGLQVIDETAHGTELLTARTDIIDIIIYFLQHGELSQ